MPRRLRILTVLIALFALSAPPAGLPAKDNGTVNFFLGGKQINGFGSGVDSHGEIGVEMSFGRIDWPVQIAVDVMMSGNTHNLIDDYTYVYSYYDPYTYTYYTYIYEYTGLDIGTSTFELDLGVRKTWDFDKSRIHPYIGGGPAFISASACLADAGDHCYWDDDIDSDMAVGWWVGGGLFWRLGERFNLGLNLRYSSAEIEFDRTGDPLVDDALFEDDDNKLDVGGVHAGLILGWGW